MDFEEFKYRLQRLWQCKVIAGNVARNAVLPLKESHVLGNEREHSFKNVQYLQTEIGKMTGSQKLLLLLPFQSDREWMLMVADAQKQDVQSYCVRFRSDTAHPSQQDVQNCTELLQYLFDHAAIKKMFGHKFSSEMTIAPLRIGAYIENAAMDGVCGGSAAGVMEFMARLVTKTRPQQQEMLTVYCTENELSALDEYTYHEESMVEQTAELPGDDSSDSSLGR